MPIFSFYTVSFCTLFQKLWNATSSHSLLSLIKIIQLSFLITYHTFAPVSVYYVVYRAFKRPNCVMSAREREALKRQNSLHQFQHIILKETKWLHGSCRI
uniref:Glycoprotein 3-alpha-L-fucosyltransferase A n=1 Tax=Schistocephalus solidus TaxID=70667 RepID=A0A0X3PUS3_SCHSO